MKNVFLAIPTYNRSVDIECCISLIHATQLALSECDAIKIVSHSGCFIAVSRNMLADAFLKARYDELIFIDDDIAFDFDAIAKLIKHDVDIVCGVAPFKNGNGFPVTLKDGYDKDGEVKDGNLYGAARVPTTFLKIRRNVFEKLIELHAEWKLSDGTYDFFRTGNLNNDGRWIGEDFAFSDACLKAGFNLWVDPSITFKHRTITYNHGKLSAFLNEQKK